MDPNNNRPDGSPNPTPNQGQEPAFGPAPQTEQAPFGSVITPNAPPAPTVVGPAAGIPPAQPAWAQPVAGAPVDPVSGGMPPTMGMNSMSPKKKFTPLLIVAGIVVLLAVAAVAYFMFFKNDSNTNANDAAKKSVAKVSAIDLSTLGNITLEAPAVIDGYTSHATGTDNVKDFVSDDNSCELIFGVVAATSLPGADLNAIVAPQISQLQKGGATVKGPNAGKALIIKEQGSSKTYNMPTLNFEFSQTDKRATVHYSAVILSGTDDRAFVNRSCVNKDGVDETAKLAALDEIAKSITVTIKP